ncbi:Fructosamine kinase-domain-containing protein [Apiospora kogelbergensis]|uniref:protein-ribulosamine 3-kinase n=1 Tax=Apiospora kogelbergensis TaxID=1337665 RepID=A0AAW0QB75_9PEZI
MDSDSELDPAIVAALPVGGKIVSIVPRGDTNWSDGFRVAVEVGDDKKEFFLKKALYQYLSDNISPALAHGTLESKPDAAFFLTKFHDLEPRVIDPAHLAAIMTKLHTTSSSPTGKFGFPVTTFKGYVPANNEWADTWEEFFARQFKEEIAWEQSVRGADAEMQQIADEFFAKVIPRLLRPLQTEGRSIKPVLCHGDLWHGNIEFDVTTQDPIMFDSCCVYGHIDLSLMVAPRYLLGARHVAAYTKEIGISEPREDFDDRLMLYNLRNELVVAGLWANWAHLREEVKKTMCSLIAKYPQGLAGAEPIIKFR